jgi:FkbM family methyltransferase
MGSEFLLLADVGATGNPKGVWREAEPFANFILFDPDPRASMQRSAGGALVYPVGLWFEQAQKTLSLAKNPEASTIYQFNDDVLKDFSNADLNKAVAEEIISVDSMDNVLFASEKWPDFIKVDAEGADLDVLNGARECLNTNCLGVFVEVSFVERHKGAGFFGDTDKLMRENNFQLMDLFPERWVRANKVSGIFTRHQVIWGDALYMINRKEFLRRLSEADPSKRRNIFFKFIFVLMLYQLHDYATEIIEYSCKEKLITEQDEIDARLALNSAMGNAPLNIAKLLASIILSSIGLLLFIPVKHLWRNNLLFFRVQFGELCNIVLRFAMRRYEGCVVDPVNPSSRL